jgi:hypothetical protein
VHELDLADPESPVLAGGAWSGLAHTFSFSAYLPPVVWRPPPWPSRWVDASDVDAPRDVGTVQENPWSALVAQSGTSLFGVGEPVEGEPLRVLRFDLTTLSGGGTRTLAAAEDRLFDRTVLPAAAPGETGPAQLVAGSGRLVFAEVKSRGTPPSPTTELELFDVTTQPMTRLGGGTLAYAVTSLIPGPADVAVTSEHDGAALVSFTSGGVSSRGISSPGDRALAYDGRTLVTAIADDPTYEQPPRVWFLDVPTSTPDAPALQLLDLSMDPVSLVQGGDDLVVGGGANAAVLAPACAQ